MQPGIVVRHSQHGTYIKAYHRRMQLLLDSIQLQHHLLYFGAFLQDLASKQLNSYVACVVVGTNALLLFKLPQELLVVKESSYLTF